MVGSVPIRSRARLAVTLGVALLASGCTSTGAMSDNSTLASADSASASASASAAEQIRYPPPPASALVNDELKAKSVVITGCDELLNGGQQAIGTVENLAATDQRFTITIDFTDADDGTAIVNWASVDVQVPAGRTVPWVAEKAFKTSRRLDCSVAAVR